MPRLRQLISVLAMVLVSIAVIGSLTSCSSSSPKAATTLELRFTRADWPEVFAIDTSTALREISAELPLWRSASATPPNQEQPSYQIKLTRTNRPSLLLYLTHDLRVFDESLSIEYLTPQKTQQLLAVSVESLNSMRFGELLPWSEANCLLPRYAICTILDIETGLTWKSQRRAGSLHADIQPLTKQDTLQLHAVYGGSWSWDRRAIVVLIGNRRIAASINGMPHGAGALRNGFPGHHCLHFWQSTTHVGRCPDPAHQVMVHKAAGKLHAYLQELQPNDLQLAMLEIAGQGDANIVKLGIINPKDGTDPSQLAKQVSNIKIWESQVDTTQSGKVIGLYNVSVYLKGDPKEYRRKIRLTSYYFDDLGRWLVEPSFLSQLLVG
ncbi:MAG TPA: hypothetical protein DDZ53_07735 [Firmicutes bacterium]|nr:hypothetical protein [Bacillota bacterium]